MAAEGSTAPGQNQVGSKVANVRRCQGARCAKTRISLQEGTAATPVLLLGCISLLQLDHRTMITNFLMNRLKHKEAALLTSGRAVGPI